MALSPLSLVVELAPLGALDSLLSSYRKSGCKLALPVLSDTATQVSRALEYLHLQHIIYRDLKSENVLVWRYPPPFSNLNEVGFISAFAFVCSNLFKISLAVLQMFWVGILGILTLGIGWRKRL